MSWPSSNAALGPFFSSEPMAERFADAARIQAMLDVEAALAVAQARCGLIPESAAAVIAEAGRTARLDIEALGRAAIHSGNLAVPLVKAFTAQVAERDAEAARWVHWGATSQDIVDTGLVLQLRRAFGLIEAEIAALGDRLAELAEQHAAMPIIGRTLMQQAVPTTLGLKLAGWLSAVSRSREALNAAAVHSLVLQFGGAAGNLASFCADGLRLAEELADELGLPLPDVPWHAQRDRIAGTGCALALLLGGLGKIARDLSLMAQTEIGEFAEPAGEGRGGSSAMPHKANPVACARILAAARRAPPLAATLLAAMDHEHERGLGGWQAEWEALPELFRLASAALESARLLADQGRFDTARMRANLDLTGGLVMAEAVSLALGRTLGKSAAHGLVEAAARKAAKQGITLREALAADPEVTVHVGDAGLGALFTPENHLGSAPDLARRAVAAWRGSRSA